MILSLSLVSFFSQFATHQTCDVVFRFVSFPFFSVLFFSCLFLSFLLMIHDSCIVESDVCISFLESPMSMFVKSR